MKKLAIVLLAVGALTMNVYAADTTTTTTTTQMTTGTDMPTAAEVNKKAGDDFLAANSKKSGVVTLPDGLQYKVITKGTGAKPTKDDIVTVNYAGTLVNGKEFDSSYTRGQPATFPVSGVIAGWTEALQMMPKGSTWMLYIPSSLAYGEQGMPPVIGPNETLIFKVELLEVNKG